MKPIERSSSWPPRLIRGEIPDDDGVFDDDDEPVDELAPHWVPTYARGTPPEENARYLSRPLWGKARSERVLCLAREVVAAIPQAATLPAARGWVAGVLCVAAVDCDMDRDPALWEHLMGDITTMTGVSRSLAERRWRDLKRAGLTAPKEPPVYWNDDP
jgi:hypothetical protein